MARSNRPLVYRLLSASGDTVAEGSPAWIMRFIRATRKGTFVARFDHYEQRWLKIAKLP